jgi:hypothetical protein
MTRPKGANTIGHDSQKRNITLDWIPQRLLHVHDKLGIVNEQIIGRQLNNLSQAIRRQMNVNADFAVLFAQIFGSPFGYDRARIADSIDKKRLGPIGRVVGSLTFNSYGDLFLLTREYLRVYL